MINYLILLRDVVNPEPILCAGQKKTQLDMRLHTFPQTGSVFAVILQVDCMTKV